MHKEISRSIADLLSAAFNNIKVQYLPEVDLVEAIYLARKTIRFPLPTGGIMDLRITPYKGESF